jgi:hypothetical protein
VVLGASGFALLCIVPPLVGVTTFDRYLLPLVPLVGILVLRTDADAAHRRDVSAAGALTCAALAIFGLVYAANSASFDGAKWEVATAAAERVGIDDVDGGFEWMNYHAGREVYLSADSDAAPRRCVLRAAPEPGPSPSDLHAAVWGPTGTQVWIVAPADDCRRVRVATRPSDD